MKIVITGANGFVGAALCRYFYDKGHEIIAIGRQSNPNLQLLSYASYIQADITTKLKPFDADVCIHAAGLASDTANYQSLYLNNVKGTENVLEASRSCKYFIFISSSSVYHFNGEPAIEEYVNLNPSLSDYGKTKFLAESPVKTHSFQQQKRLILRPRAIYGPGDRVLLPRLLKLIKWQRILCPVNKEIKTSATHVNNLGYAIALFLNQKYIPDVQVLNIADDRIYTLKDIILKTIFALEGRNLPVVDISPLLKALPFFQCIHTSKHLTPVAIKAFTENSVLDLGSIKKTLNYRPLQNFDNSYLDIGEWIKDIGGKKAYFKNINEAPWMIKK